MRFLLWRPLRYALSLLLPIALAAACVGCTAEPDRPSPPAESAPSLPSSPSSPHSPSPPSPPVETDPIRKQVEAMTLKQKVGQMIIAGVAGTEIDEETKSLIALDHVGGFILYKANIESAEQTVRLLNGLKEANGADSAPLLLGVDQEGGRVNRLPATFAAVPSSRDIAKSKDSGKARAVGEAIGETLAALGFNVNFAPVLDIDSNPANPVIGPRSFGPTAAIVSEFGIAEMLGLRSRGVIPVVKHFPGHGDTSVDSHLDLPVVDKTPEQLRRLELVPFADAIRSNAEAVMIAHILLSNIDPEHPASMSSKVIAGLLRDEMGFDGVVITDDMTMGAIVKHYDIGAAAVQSVKAGSDIVLVAHEYAQAKKALAALEKAVQTGDLDREAINRSVERILRLKASYKLDGSLAGPVDLERINTALTGAAGKP